jgi:O-succinylbenzoate synthase
MRVVQSAYFPYELISINQSLGMRQGALLKIVFADHLVGYADCHPWPELGDIPLAEQVALFSQGHFETPHLKRALFFARLDAEARSQKVNLFDGLVIPNSHYLALDWQALNILEAREQGFEAFKFKVTPQLDLPLLKKRIKQLEGTSCKVRLDFNATFTRQRFESFLEEIKEHLPLIDFCEDPFPYDAEQWKSVQEKYAISLACDRHSGQALHCVEAARVLIVKPALQDPYRFLESAQRLIMTSSLDHPLGQLCAAYEAAKVNASRSLDLCGLLSHHVYRDSPFSQALPCHGPLFGKPVGTGMGLDELLETIPWKKNS